MSKFEYPKLPRHEIVAVLAEYQIAAVSEADLLRPDPDFICNLYSHIYLHIGTREDDEGQIEFGALELLENPENHAHSIQLIDLYNKIRQIIEAVKCPKAFTPKDLIKPEPDRTELFLGALINFLLHRLSKRALLKEYDAELTDLGEQELAVKARISQLEAEIVQCEESREKDLPLIQEITSKIKELQKTVSGLNQHQMTLRTSIKQLKEKSKEMDDKISEAEFSLVQAVQENANLRSKIVQSPDKLQRALEEKKMVHNDAKKAERAAVQTFQNKTTLLESYTKAFMKMSKHLTRMQDLQEQSNSAKTVDKDVKALKNKLSEEGVLIKSLEAKLLELQSKEFQLKEHKRQLEKERALKEEEVNKELKNVELEVEAKMNSLETIHRQVESMVKEAEEITMRKNDIKKDGEVKIQELGRTCEEIVRQFHNYSKSITNLVEMSEADLGSS